MKYFTVDRPYFSLIRAEGIERATDIYQGTLRMIPHEAIEKTRNEALDLYLANEFGDYMDLINEFNRSQDEDALLLIDRGLI